jgi:hypothetical protein
MRRGLLVSVVAALLLLTAAAPVPVGGRPLHANLSGVNEVPTVGDPDGSGTIQLTLNQGRSQICFKLDVRNIATPTRAHIHRGGAGVNGPIEVTFFDTVIANPVPVRFQGCVPANKWLVKEIRQNPSGFYVNVHTAAFPAGAIRGQLGK